MEIEALIKKMKDINPAPIDFIEADEDCDAKFKMLTLISLIDFKLMKNKKFSKRKKNFNYYFN